MWLLLERLPLGTWSTTQACALTGNRTGDPSLRRPAQSTEPHQPGRKLTSGEEVALEAKAQVGRLGDDPRQRVTAVEQR